MDTFAKLSVMSTDVVLWARLQIVHYVSLDMIITELAEVQLSHVVNMLIHYKSL